MQRDELIIWVYLWVCEQVGQLKASWPNQRARRGGFAPALSDEEALCIELCGEMLRLGRDQAIVAHFQAYYQEWFPHLKDRSAFARQVANLWRIKDQLNEALLREHFAFEHLVQPVDTVPVPVCAKVRARRNPGLAGSACKGFCAAKDTYYYGFKLGLRVTQCGFITAHELLAANIHDSRVLEVLTPCAQSQITHGHRGHDLSGPHTSTLVPVDKGFFNPAVWQALFERGIHIVGHGPKQLEFLRPQQVALPDWIERLCARVRKTVEVVAHLLCSRFHIDAIRVRDVWHLRHRLARKVLAFNLLVALNLHLHRSPLDLDGLVRD